MTIQSRVWRVISRTPGATAAAIAGETGLPRKSVNAALLDLFRSGRIRKELGRGNVGSYWVVGKTPPTDRRGKEGFSHLGRKQNRAPLRKPVYLPDLDRAMGYGV